MRNNKSLAVLVFSLTVCPMVDGLIPQTYSREVGWEEKEIDWDRFLKALAQMESGGLADPDAAVGDDGAAIGRYQIHEVCWIDAALGDGEYTDCHKADYAARVVKAYLIRYGRKQIHSGDVEALARKWNGGGPKGDTKKATEKYGQKFRKIWDSLA